MKTHSDVEIGPISDINCGEFMSTKEDLNLYDSHSNSNSSNQENSLDDFIIVSSSESPVIVQDNSCEQEDDSDYFAQFSCPEESDNELKYFSNENNNDLFLNNHLNRKQLDLTDNFQDNNYQRSKRSNKKINAQRQIKTKDAKSIRTNSHNKQLYMHHRLFKKVHLDPPSEHYLASDPPVPLYSLEALRSIIHELRQRYHHGVSNNHNKIQQPTTTHTVPSQLRDYTINEHNIPNDATFDDAMISFLLEMQNRDLSPEDYEMLLRLDERVQRKTIDTNILNTLPTVTAAETHVTEQCTICMETYTLGQQLKLLPCTHIFHLHCIETYLKEFSNQCPLDNLPLI